MSLSGVSRSPRMSEFRLLLGLVLCACCLPARAGDWPVYRHDNARSGVTEEQLPRGLVLQWTHRPQHAPRPAWGDPQPKPIEGYLEVPRVRFDDANHVAAVGGRIYYGSSADDSLYCVDAASGRTLWTFRTGGAIRLAPAVWEGRVYFGSDDGRAYCVDAAGGTLVWKVRPAPSDERVLGQGRMISLWPIRTGVLVADGVAYFGAGLFPAEGLYLVAADARTGKVLWRNDTIARGGLGELSPQGYMLADKDHLIVMSGRAGPAMFDRKSGALIIHKNLHRWTPAGPVGGSLATIHGGYVFSGAEKMASYSLKNKLKEGHAWVQGRRLIVTDEGYLYVTGGEVVCYDAKMIAEGTAKQFVAALRAKEKAARPKTIARLRKDLAGAEQARVQLGKAVADLERQLTALGWRPPPPPATAPAPATRPAKSAAGAKAPGKGAPPSMPKGKPKSAPKAERRPKAKPATRAKAPSTPDAAKREALVKRWTEARKKLRAATDKVAGLRKKIQSEEKALKELLAIEARSKELLRKGLKWKKPCAHWDSMLLAGQTLYVGGAGEVLAWEVSTGKPAGALAIHGRARGLAVAGGRLLVSSDTGEIHCFAGAARAKPLIVAAQQTEADPFDADGTSKAFAAWAGRIVQDSGVRRGYALITRGGRGRLAAALARKTELMIYVVEPDAAKASAAREALSRAGLLGVRASVENGPVDRIPYSDYFANLIVCQGDGLSGANPAGGAKELLRMLKPCGGKAYVLTGPDVKSLPSARVAAARENVKSALADDTSLGLKVTPAGVRVDRGALPGAGKWTHQYGEPGNTACSDDQRIQGPLGVLWFGEPGPARMPSRHGSAPAPLAMDGRMFVQGEDVMLCYDSYNGLLLWETPIKGAVQQRLYGTGMKTEMSNLAAAGDSVFVVVGNQCHRLDAATGKIRHTYTAPPGKAPLPDGTPKRWGYLAVTDGALYGTRSARGKVGECVFAMDVDGGKLRWSYDGKDIMHDTIAVGGGRVYLVDRDVTPRQVARAVAERPKGLGKPLVRKDRKGKPIPPDVRLAVALDAKTGRAVWQKPIDVTDCVKIGRSGGELSAIYKNEVLLLFGQPWNGHFWKEFLAGQFSRRSILAMSAGDGRYLWTGNKGYRSRPLVVGETVYAEPWAHSLYSGEPKMRTHPVTGAEGKWQMSRPGHHCGCIAAAPNYLLFRSGTTAYYDLSADTGTEHFGAQRPGCWINFIPANGVLMIPEASSGCVCPFSIHTTVVMHPRKTERTWCLASAPGAMTPVQQIRVNLGAPGDRRDAAGQLWLSYPRPFTIRLAMTFPMDVKFAPGGAYERHSDEATPIPGAAEGWLYSYGARGPASCRLPLLGRKDPGGALYTVRLHFVDLPGGPPPAAFDVKLQGKTVARQLDLAGAAGGKSRPVIREFKDVPVALDLQVDLVVPEKTPPGRLPILSAIEVVRTKLVPDMKKPPEPTTKPTTKPAGKKRAPKK